MACKTIAPALVVALAAAAAFAAETAVPARGYTADQARLLAIDVAHADGVNRLAEMALGARVSAVRTLGEALGFASDGEIALRVFLRSARVIGEPRVYSDGVAEVDAEIPIEAVIRKVHDLYTPGEHETAAMDELRYQAVDDMLRTSGTGRPPGGISDEVMRGVEAARPEDLPELFPAGWEGVTATGRVEAVRRARVRAYEAMGLRLRGLLLGQTETVDGLLGGVSAAEAMFDAFVRSLPVAGDPRMMPDRIAEVDVAAPVRDVIRVLKDVRRLRGSEVRLTEEQIDRLSVRLKTDRLAVTGRGMPPADAVHAADAPAVAGGAPLPDWATQVLEATGTARFSDDVADREEARVLAARAAKVRAGADLRQQVDALTLAEDLTVRQLAARDPAFARDVGTFLSSAHTRAHRATPDGKAWEVTLRLPLIRLYACYRARP